jgi:DNA invertase Pin-like site-specific DNA recombinase
MGMQAAVYLRISEDRSGEGLGVARQRKDCLKLCSEKGWEPVEYVDNDVSASNGKSRPAYKRMLAGIENGAVGAVVNWDLGLGTWDLGLGQTAPASGRT